MTTEGNQQGVRLYPTAKEERELAEIVKRSPALQRLFREQGTSR